MKAVSFYFRNLQPALCLYRFVLAFLSFVVGLAFGGVLGVWGVATIIRGVFEANPGFHVGWRHAGRVQYLFFSSFWLVLKKISFWCWDWALGLGASLSF